MYRGFGIRSFLSYFLLRPFLLLREMVGNGFEVLPLSGEEARLLLLAAGVFFALVAAAVLARVLDADPPSFLLVPDFEFDKLSRRLAGAFLPALFTFLAAGLVSGVCGLVAAREAGNIKCVFFLVTIAAFLRPFEPL